MMSFILIREPVNLRGGVIDNNLFLGFDSPWCCNFSITIADGKCATLEGNRTTYFFKVKPNTTYRYTATTAGGRFTVCAIKNEYDTPPTFVKSMYPYTETQSGIRAIENRPQILTCMMQQQTTLSLLVRTTRWCIFTLPWRKSLQG